MCGFINFPTVDSVVTVFLAHSSGDRLADDCLSRFCLRLGKSVKTHEDVCRNVNLSRWLLSVALVAI